MSKGSPNTGKKQNFVLKVRDPSTKKFVPAYILPDATDKILGGVYLSDKTDSSDNAATGVTAATPAAVKAVKDDSLSISKGASQSVNGYIDFKNGITLDIDKSTLSGIIPKENLPEDIGHKQKLYDYSVKYSGENTSPIKGTLAQLLLEKDKPYQQGDIVRVMSTVGPVASYNGQSWGIVRNREPVLYLVLGEDVNVESSYCAVEATYAAKAGKLNCGDILDKLVQFADGSPVPSVTTIGSSTQPIYLKDGSLQAAKELNAANVGAVNTKTLSLTGDTTGSVSLNSTSSSQSIATTIAASAVTEGKIASNAVTTAKIKDANVTTGKLADNAVITAKIKDANVTTGKLADNAVTIAKIADSNITTAKIADNAVITDKIANANVTTGKLADNAVTTVKIADSNVTTAKIADSNITTTKIANSAVTSAKIANNTITIDDLATTVGACIVSSTEPTDTKYKLWVKPASDDTPIQVYFQNV